MVLLVPARSPAQDLPGFVAMAREARGGVSFGSGGIGNASHLAAALLASRAGFDWTHVPYGGAAPSQTALLGGQVQAIFQNPILSVPAVRDGRVRALAVTGAGRWRDLPDVPTAAEAGLPGFEAISWYGVLGPAGLPPPVAASLEEAFRAALRAPEVEARLLQAGLELHGDGGAVFRARMQRDLEAWGAVIRGLGIRPE
jgi:tripartite-type tricarboxylate transporter receptor subunit TctC